MHVFICIDIFAMTLMEPKFYDKRDDLTFLSSSIPFSAVTSRHLLHMVFTCRNWFDILESVIPIGIVYIDLSW